MGLSHGDYYQALYEIQVKIKNKTSFEKTIIWEECYNSIQHPLIPEELHISLTLVNPEF